MTSPFVQNPSCDTPSFNCGSRIAQLGQPDAGLVLDGWRKMPNGDHTCSYCGSLSEDDFLDICDHYAAGEPGYRFDSSTKGYKRYANRPGVSNASEGGIKFYGWHATPGEDKDRRYAAALERFRATLT